MGWNELIDVFKEEWAQRALMASTMVGLMCGVLGCFIVLRNMSLIGDALSHAILPGIVVAFIAVGYNALGFFVGSVMAGLIAAVVITWIQQKGHTKNDAAIGIVFTAMFALGVIGISWISKTGGVHLDLKDFLFGNVLGVSDEDLVLTGIISFYVIVSIVVFYRYLFASTFQPVIAKTMGIPVHAIHYFLMLLLSFAVVAALRTVGVILVVAMLITPASTALLLTNRLKQVIMIAGLLGMFSSVLGLVAAIIFETTPGPAMAVVSTLFYFLALFFSPLKGLFFSWLNKSKQRKRILLEDVLKQIYSYQERGVPDLQTILRHQSLIKQLRQLGYIESQKITLTEAGMAEAKRLVRAHRLWESYLVDHVGLSAEQIHDDAEHYEHHLPDELLDEVERSLGFPKVDPHGSPIPSKAGWPDLSIFSLALNQKAHIAAKQDNPKAISELWNLGIYANATLEVVSKQNDFVEVSLGGKLVKLQVDLARWVKVEPEGQAGNFTKS